MSKICILSHGGLARGMLSTLSIFLTDVSAITAISAYVDDCDPKVELENFFSSVKDEEQVVIFTDILGGSVNQYAIPYLNRKNTYIFAGFNFPLILQFALSSQEKDMSIEEFRSLAESGKEALIFMNDYQFENFDEEDE